MNGTRCAPASATPPTVDARPRSSAPPMRWKWCFLVIGLLLSFVAHAETGLSDADIDKLAAQPGTEVTKSQEADTQIPEIRRADVIVTIRQHGDKAETIGED